MLHRPTDAKVNVKKPKGSANLPNSHSRVQNLIWHCARDEWHSRRRGGLHDDFGSGGRQRRALVFLEGVAVAPIRLAGACPGRRRFLNRPLKHYPRLSSYWGTPPALPLRGA
jgi:hypothetical protein